MKKTKVRTAMNIYTIFNLINIVIALVFEMLRPYYTINKAITAVGNAMFYLISAYSYIAVPGLLFSIAGTVYYFIGCLKWEDRSSAYLFLLFSMINVISIGFFMLLAMAT